MTPLAKRSILAVATTVALGVLLAATVPPSLRWTSYEYIGPGRDAFHDAAPVDDGLAVDDSGWTIDWPEDPDSILAILTYPSWTGARVPDLTGGQAIVTLRGEDLDLHGGHATFWIVDDVGRCHHTEPIATDGTTTLDLDAAWHRSWTRNAPGPCSLDRVVSYGIAFVGFDAEPTGRLVLEDLRFTR